MFITAVTGQLAVFSLFGEELSPHAFADVHGVQQHDDIETSLAHARSTTARRVQARGLQHEVAIRGESSMGLGGVGGSAGKEMIPGPHVIDSVVLRGTATQVVALASRHQGATGSPTVCVRTGDYAWSLTSTNCAPTYVCAHPNDLGWDAGSMTALADLGGHRFRACRSAALLGPGGLPLESRSSLGQPREEVDG